MIASFIEPNHVQITRLEKVLNIGLWNRFVNHRRDKICSKSNNLGLLRGFGLAEQELLTRAHAFVNFDGGCSTEYSDNVALLYHCTRTNVETVLAQGLDERLGSSGLLGRGIYFADSPTKAINYDSNGVILIFAVYLGDCPSKLQLRP